MTNLTKVHDLPYLVRNILGSCTLVRITYDKRQIGILTSGLKIRIDVKTNIRIDKQDMHLSCGKKTILEKKTKYKLISCQ